MVDPDAELGPSDLSMLDSIHLATAPGIIDDCDGISTYDARLADAARGHGLTVLAPA